MTPGRRILLSIAVLAALLSTAGCSLPGGVDDPVVVESPVGGTAAGDVGETAVWELADPSGVSPQSEQVDLLVSRLECASGVTGATLPPVVSLGEADVVIRVDASWNGTSGGTCPANDLVPVTVQLGEPLGQRALVDGACLREDAAGTASCEDSGVRLGGR